MIMKIYKLILSWSFNKVYGKNIDTLVNEINAETWIGAQIETGGHALGCLKPIGNFEAISIKCVLTGSKTCQDGSIKTRSVDYWNKNWI